MKKKALSLLLVLIMVLSLVPVSAFGASYLSGECGKSGGRIPDDSVQWKMNLDTGTLTIYGEGDMADYVGISIDYFAIAPWRDHSSCGGTGQKEKYVLEDSITKVVVKEGVTSLGDTSIYKLPKLKSVSLPSTLKSIGKSALGNNKSLKKITIPDSVEIIDQRAFAGSGLTSIVIPDGVTTIRGGAFKGCVSLTSAIVPDSVTTLEEAIFADCDRLTKVVLPDHLTELRGLFDGCRMLEEIVLPTNLKKLYNCFSGTAVESLTIPAGVTYVGGFAGANKLKTVFFLGDAPEIVPRAFEELQDLTVYYPAGNDTWTDVIAANYSDSDVTWKAWNPLQLTAQPQSVKVKSGETAAVTVEAVGDGLQYAWYYAAPGSDTFQKTSSFTGDTYAITMNDSRAGRRVYCRVSDKYGNVVKTDKVTLSMDSDLAITAQPVSVTVDDGQKASVTVKASGLGLKYQWYWAAPGSDDFALTTSFKTDTYAVTMNDSRDGRQVYCKVTDKFGNYVISEVVTLNMGQTPLALESQPTDVTVKEGKKASVTVKVSGTGLQYAWYWAAPGSDDFQRTGSFKTATYAITMNASRDGRRVYCEITDKYGEKVTTEPVTLSMAAKPVITVEPTFVYAKKGAKATVSFEAEGEGLQYQWYWAKAGSSKYTLTKTFDGPEYFVEMNDSRAGRKVYCVVTDKYGQSVKTKTVTLRMELEIVKNTPSAVYADFGEKATVAFDVYGQGLQYQWYYSDDNGATFKKTNSFKGDTYSVELTMARMRRRVYCVVTDKYGNTVRTGTTKILHDIGMEYV